MIKYTTGDLFQSSTEALVNTVNCEGYMGKGIAYQFKLKYPENNKDYKRAVKSGDLRIGTLHHFEENGKIIINFPTKDKWRAKSKMEYIEKGLNALILLIDQLNLKSVAIPPLGSGNGGLNWQDVKKLMEEKMAVVDDNVEIYIYEPSQNYKVQPKVEPKLSLSALILMDIKHHLQRFNKLRLQKTAFYMDVLSGESYFKFQKYKFGPYDNGINIISRNIKEFQDYHGVKKTGEAYYILYNKLVSDQVNSKLQTLQPFVKEAAELVNKFSSDHELECVSTITYLLKENQELNEEEIVAEFKVWSKDKGDRFSESEIRQGIQTLYEARIIEKTLMGYIINQSHALHYN
ncbi:macro domain-containing protein [Lentibacillus sp. CBA3610]|uniref:type II toxin-antitoxin system antitoxin DNA ADP-ribosyl glycohydrolase DarG n=1 Tax=Lentibacillus sp. CBA3610 TaxID=2518176 RepID=UPI0015961DF2|nr:macro domain-containing protein [Lentibacillus sp. CBA3610]QKY70258.1 Appr-1-p processing protein [Lentibacillus sp. CBA3610]